MILYFYNIQKYLLSIYKLILSYTKNKVFYKLKNKKKAEQAKENLSVYVRTSALKKDIEVKVVFFGYENELK